MIALRLIIIPGIVLAWFVLDQLVSRLVPIRALKRLFSYLFGNLVLFLSGFYYVSFSSFSPRKPLNSSVSSASSPARGTAVSRSSVRSAKNFNVNVIGSDSNDGAVDVLLCNHSSYVDIVFFEALCSPIFLQASLERPDLFCKRSFWQALFDCLFHRLSKDRGEAKSIIELQADSSSIPLLIFLEGTTGNGRGLLKLTDAFPGLSLKDTRRLKLNFHLFALKYEFDHAAPTFPAGPWLPHLINNIFSQVSCFFIDEREYLFLFFLYNISH